MTTIQWSAFLGFALPMLVAFVNRETWKPQIKAGVAVLSCVVVGTVNVLLAGGLNFSMSNWATAVGVVFAASQLAYHTIWKNSNITDWIEQSLNIISGKPNAAPPATPPAA